MLSCYQQICSAPHHLAIIIFTVRLKNNIHNILLSYQQEMQTELSAILKYWQQHTIDNINGGFWGKINTENIVDAEASKGVVLHSRILWTFSAAYKVTQDETHLQTAHYAFEYLKTNFKDDAYGGVFWSVNYKGKAEETRKQIYGLAFTLYGLSEYYAAAKNDDALSFAKDLFNTIEQYSFDTENNGYHEAFTRNWQPLNDLRLSAKDANASKTMNTHLHVIEAYANLYTVWHDETVKQKTENLLFLFDEYFIDKQTNHLILFFDNEWNEQPDVVSYGHDIEAAWLLLRCAEITGNKDWIAIYQSHAQSIAEAASEGLDADGGLWYEYEPQHNQLIKQKHWWPQAEAMIGYLNAYEVSGKEEYLEKSLQAWKFTQTYLLDKENGEWFWGIDEAYRVMPGEDKAGFWKCPYHNSRACLEVIRRIQSITQEN